MARFIGIMCTLTVFAARADAPADKDKQVAHTVEAVVRFVAADGSTLWTADADGRTATWKAGRVKDQVKALASGDFVSLIAIGDELQDLRGALIATTPNARYSSYGLFVVLVVAFVVFLGGSKALVGADGRYSKSKFQAAVWFSLLISGYVTTFVLRAVVTGRFGGIGIPENLLVLSGFSAATFAAAKGIAVAKANAFMKVGGASRGLVRDLLQHDDGKADLGDAQMLIVAALAIVVWTVQILASLDHVMNVAVVHLPDIDSTVLALTGIGQGAYLAKKGLESPTPATSLAPAPAPVAAVNTGGGGAVAKTP